MNDPTLQTQSQNAQQPAKNPALQDMRDIHEPPPVSDWPAPGWWLLTVLIVALIVLLYRQARRFNRKRAYRREADRELTLAHERFRSSGNGHAFAQELLALLKRTALTAYPGDQDRIAGLHGRDWLKFLDNTCNNCQFSSQEGDALIEAAYSDKIDNYALQHSYTQARLWIAGHRKEGGQLRA